MKSWVVWEEEYPEGGGLLVEAWTEKGAARKWRKMMEMQGPVSRHPGLMIVEEEPW